MIYTSRKVFFFHRKLSNLMWWLVTLASSKDPLQGRGRWCQFLPWLCFFSYFSSRSRKTWASCNVPRRTMDVHLMRWRLGQFHPVSKCFQVDPRSLPSVSSVNLPVLAICWRQYLAGSQGCAWRAQRAKWAPFHPLDAPESNRLMYGNVWSHMTIMTWLAN